MRSEAQDVEPSAPDLMDLPASEVIAMADRMFAGHPEARRQWLLVRSDAHLERLGADCSRSADAARSSRSASLAAADRFVDPHPSPYTRSEDRRCMHAGTCGGR